MVTVLSLSHEIDPRVLKLAVECIRDDGVMAVATESSYALAAGVQHPASIRRIARMKGDRQSKPILLLVSSKVQVLDIASDISSVAESLMDRFWPGPLTLVLPALPELPDSLTAGSQTIGIRQPDCPELIRVLEATGPLTGTSANRSGEEPMTTADMIVREFGEEVDLILDSGPSPGGAPSTLVNLVGGIRILRPGPISSGSIQDVLISHGLQVQEGDL